ncbi:uncharacterized protein [Dermacentor andersoni]|uniref:uncharacterized protein isoform X2 n=1 Tax=Dermacentor andersoni TaxID=34620 RepID=UPI0021554998|nr:uncharacterized protein LOC126517885 isoform X2 [Dermacentor andersoni]
MRRESFRMPNVCCAVKGCQRHRESNEGVYFHTLPPSASRKRKWEKAIGCTLPYSARVCSAHFLASDYLLHYGDQRPLHRLKWTAVPSVDLCIYEDVIHAVKQEPPQSPTTSAGESGESSGISPKAEIGKKSRHRCAVVGCTKPTKPLHRMPQNLELRRKWLEIIGLLESETRTFLFVCKRHFAADAYTLNPDLLQDMGFTTRYYLRADAVPSLFLPSDLKQEAQQETPQSHSTAETQPQAPLRQYGRIRPRGTMSTQTAPYQRTVRAQATPLAKGKDADMQADLDFGVSAGTQTDDLALFTRTTQNIEQNAASPPDRTCDCSCHRVCHCSCRQSAVNSIATQTTTIGSVICLWTS